jgi:hypothetical protein
MLPALEDQFIDETFGGMIHTSNKAVSSSELFPLYDGYGNQLPIKVSNNQVQIGTLTYPTSAVENDSALIYKDGAISFQRLINSVYPIGAIYLSVDASNPSTIFGGTWNQIGLGRFLVGVGTGTDINSFGKTFISGENDGEYRHTQTVGELVSHNHDVYITQSSQNDDNTSTSTGDIGTSSRSIAPVNLNAAGLTTLNKGGNQPFNVTPPSFGVYMWQRTN